MKERILYAMEYFSTTNYWIQYEMDGFRIVKPVAVFKVKKLK